jgi:hypothetical protein
MNVGELRTALEKLSDDLPVVLEIVGGQDIEDEYVSCYLIDAEVEEEEGTNKRCLFLSGEVATVAEEEEEEEEAETEAS